MTKPEDFDIQRFVYLWTWANTEGDITEAQKLYQLQTHGIQIPQPDHDNHFWTIFLSDSYKVYVAKSKTKDLQEILDVLEDEFSKRKLLRFSPAIAKSILDNADGVKKGSIEALALEVHKVKDPTCLIRGIRTGLRLSGNTPTKNLLMAVTSKLYLFEGEEEDIVRKINELPRKKVLPTPKKVLSKMVGLRLWRIKDKVEETKGSISRDPYRIERYKPFLTWTLPDLRTKQDVLSLKGTGPHTEAFSHYGMASLVVELLTIFEEKTDVDDEIVNDAWNRVLVGEVMES